jgi:glycolate oxidase FAD binding subunit
MPAVRRPSTVAEAAATLVELAHDGRPVRPVGTGSRSGWGGRDVESTVDLHTGGLNRILEHNPGDFTAILQAGVTLADAQAAFATAGQWLAVDPAEPSGTIGGLVATADSGPVRHRYGSIRDLVIGITVALSDGTVAASGGKVIKNVAGYDLGKLFTGSYGTLGLITSVAVRLHPRPTGTVTLSADTDDPTVLGRMAVNLARAPLEALSLDAWWRAGRGGLLVRFAGISAAEQAERSRALLPAGASSVSLVEDDETLWTRQRAGQRQPAGIVMKVSGRITDLPRVVAEAEAAGAELTSRAGLGLSWLRLPAAGNDQNVTDLRQALAPRACTVLDGSTVVSQPWPAGAPDVLAVMNRLKARFDPARIFRPGSYLGGI